MIKSNDYSITDYEWSTDYDSWEPGKKVTLKVTLETPEGIQYEDEYTLVWDKVQYAGGYEVKIYRDGSSYKTVSIEGRSNTEFDLSDYATDDYLITAALRAVAPSGKTKYIAASDWVMFDDESVSSSENSTVYGSFSGSGSSKKFKDSDGNTVSGWQEINGTWYYFDPGNKDNAVVSQWATLGGHSYIFDEDGKMQTGWVKNEDYWYYLNDGSVDGLPVGALLTNTTTSDGYAVDANGAWNG
ncbi:MAG: hypothetical protein LIO92_04805 [Clostridiales bacterium]|nr:hypothetical protein [Clostridiales bacterium]